MERILVTGFKAIRNEGGRWVPVKPLMLLMGEQASGKSTFAKLLYFFKTLPDEIVAELIRQAALGNEENTSLVITGRLRRYFVYLFGATRHLEEFQIEYEYPTGGRLRLTREAASGNLRVDFGNQWNRIQEIARLFLQEMRQLPEHRVDALSRNRRESLQAALNRDIWRLFGQQQEQVYMPASRNVTVSLAQVLREVYGRVQRNLDELSFDSESRFASENELLIYRFIEYSETLVSLFRRGGGFQGVMTDQEELSGNPANRPLAEALIRKAEEVLKGRYAADEHGEKIVFGPQGAYVALSNASSGQQESIRILQDLFQLAVRQRPVFRVYEEPESHLHPAAQRSLVEAAAAALAGHPGSQILFPTHSPYILLALDNLIRAGELAARYPALGDRITAAGVAAPYRLRFEQVSAWQLEGGEFSEALSQERQGLSADFVDRPAREMEDVFDALLALEYEYAGL